MAYIEHEETRQEKALYRYSARVLRGLKSGTQGYMRPWTVSPQAQNGMAAMTGYPCSDVPRQSTKRAALDWPRTPDCQRLHTCLAANYTHTSRASANAQYTWNSRRRLQALRGQALNQTRHLSTCYHCSACLGQSVPVRHCLHLTTPSRQTLRNQVNTGFYIRLRGRALGLDDAAMQVGTCGLI